MNGEPYPLDYSKLQKGSMITTSECERITGVLHDSKKYAWAILRLRGRIMRDMRQRGTPVTIRSTQDGLEVLTDAQASAYNARHQRLGIRKHFRGHRRNAEVDISNLTPEERDAHEKRLLASSRLIQAIRSTRQQIKVEAHERTTPVLTK